MTVIRSASGMRIDCDTCGTHTASSNWSDQDLRDQARFVRHAERDWCGDCWAARSDTAEPAAPDDGPAAA